MKKTSKENLIFSAPFSLSEAKANGLSRRMVYYYESIGVLERVKRGIYQGSKFEFKGNILFEELVTVASNYKEGVVCLVSALRYYNLTDEMMREIWIAIPNNKGPYKKDGVRFVRFRNMKLGVEIKSEGGISFNIFNKERTIIDSFRYLDINLSLTALKYYLKITKEHKPNIDQLLDYSEKLKTPIRKYVEAILA